MNNKLQKMWNRYESFMYSLDSILQTYLSISPKVL